MSETRRLPHLAAFSPRGELLLAMSILAVLVLLLSMLIGSIDHAWVSGEQKVETHQEGRAILKMMARELSQAVISPNLQMVQNASLPNVTERPNANNLFWQASLTSTESGNLCEVGYFLTEDAGKNFRLIRFFVPPTDATNYRILGTAPSDREALWATNFVQSASPLHTVVSDQVVALWIRSFDANGDPIPVALPLCSRRGATPI